MTKKCHATLWWPPSSPMCDSFGDTVINIATGTPSLRYRAINNTMPNSRNRFETFIRKNNLPVSTGVNKSTSTNVASSVKIEMKKICSKEMINYNYEYQWFWQAWYFRSTLVANFVTASKNIASLISGQNWPKNDRLTPSTKIDSKPLIQLVQIQKQNSNLKHQTFQSKGWLKYLNRIGSLDVLPLTEDDSRRPLAVHKSTKY